MSAIKKDNVLSVLIAHKIPIHLWGTGGAKTLGHLEREIEDGETELNISGNILIRKISVINIDVFCRINGSLYLLKEDRQVFGDGRERKRGLAVSLAEKIKPGENRDMAAIRAVKEELGISEVLPITWGPESSKGPEESPSYPGLMTEYHFYKHEVYLPEKYFNSEGFIEKDGDLTVYFIWTKI